MENFKDQQNKTDNFLSAMVSCNFVALKRAIKFFAVSLVDPFTVDCIILDKDITHYSTGKFYDKHSI